MSQIFGGIVNRRTYDATDSLRASYQSAKPFRYLVVDDFLDADYCEALLNSFPPFDEKKALSENGTVGRKSTHEQIAELGGPFRRLDEIIQTKEFLGWVGKITGIPDLLYDPHYFGGGTHLNRHGQDLDPHVDFNRHPVTNWHRRLNLIVYLNHEWEADWGGAIEFHKDPRLSPEQNEITLVQPRFNRAVLFETTSWSWHGFERINLPQGDDDPRARKSVALYFYSEERPQEEMTKPHSTIYVERPLPEHIRPGLTLSEEDFNRVQTLIHRRDQHLQRLYRNISDLGAEVEHLKIQTSQLRAAKSPSDAPLPETGQHREATPSVTPAQRSLPRRALGRLRRVLGRGKRWLMAGGGR